MTRLIDADEFISELEGLYKKAGWDRREIHFSLADVVSNIEMIPTIINRQNEEKTVYNCKHGAYGFDGDLGCSLWHHGIADPSVCGSWKGTEE